MNAEIARYVRFISSDGAKARVWNPQRGRRPSMSVAGRRASITNPNLVEYYCCRALVAAETLERLALALAAMLRSPSRA